MVLICKETMSSIPYPYLILGVETSASTEEVERAYKQKMLKYHPDKFPPTMDEQKKRRYLEKFRAITQARDDILKELRDDSSKNHHFSHHTTSKRTPTHGGIVGVGLFDDLFNIRQLDDVFEAMEQRLHSMKIIDGDGTTTPQGTFYSRTEVFKNDNGRKMRSIQENNNGTIRTYDEVDGRRVNRRQLK